jgi:hypothetical protein
MPSRSVATVLIARRLSLLHFEPIGRAARTIWGILPLRHNAFQPKLAGVTENGLAVAVHVLVKSEAGSSLEGIMA